MCIRMHHLTGYAIHVKNVTVIVFGQKIVLSIHTSNLTKYFCNMTMSIVNLWQNSRILRSHGVCADMQIKMFSCDSSQRYSMHSRPTTNYIQM